MDLVFWKFHDQYQSLRVCSPHIANLIGHDYREIEVFSLSPALFQLITAEKPYCVTFHPTLVYRVPPPIPPDQLSVYVVQRADIPEHPQRVLECLPRDLLQRCEAPPDNIEMTNNVAYARLATVIGPAAADEMCAAFGGRKLRIPRLSRKRGQKAQHRLYSRYQQGTPLEALAKQSRCHLAEVIDTIEEIYARRTGHKYAWQQKRTPKDTSPDAD